MFDESKHPRDEYGRFTYKGYSSRDNLGNLVNKVKKANPERVLKNELVIKLPDLDEEEFAYEVDSVVNGTFDKENSHIKVLSKTPQMGQKKHI